MIVLRNKLFAKFKLSQTDVREFLPKLRTTVAKERGFKPNSAFFNEHIYNNGKDIRKWTYKWKPNSQENLALRYLRQNYTRDAAGNIVKKNAGKVIRGGMPETTKMVAAPVQ